MMDLNEDSMYRPIPNKGCNNYFTEELSILKQQSWKMSPSKKWGVKWRLKKPSPTGSQSSQVNEFFSYMFSYVFICFFYLVRFLLGFRSAVFQRLIIIFAIYKTRRFQRLPSPCWPILVFFLAKMNWGFSSMNSLFFLKEPSNLLLLCIWLLSDYPLVN